MSGAARMRCIGVLGGMGPQATVLLMSRVIAMTRASNDCDHVPMLVDNNPQVPSRIEAIVEGTGTDPGAELARMARGLAAAGVEALAMPCNSAHHFAPRLREAVQIPLLDMVELSADHLAGMDWPAGAGAGRRIGMLASPAIGIAKVFEPAFAARGLEPVYPRAPRRLLGSIKEIKAAGPSDAARSMLRETAAELRAVGVDVLLVACTELSIIADSLPRDVPVLDTIDVLAAAVVAFSTGAAPRGQRDDTGHRPRESGLATWRSLVQGGSLSSPRGVSSNCRTDGVSSDSAL